MRPAGPDVWEVLDAAFTKPFGIMPFYPGPGSAGTASRSTRTTWSGSREFNFNTHFIALAGEINRKMPEFVRTKAAREARTGWARRCRGRRSSPWGCRTSGTWATGGSPRPWDVIELLQEDGAEVVYHDPHVPEFRHRGHKGVRPPNRRATRRGGPGGRR